VSAPLHQRRADVELAELKAGVGRVGARVRRAVEQAAEAAVRRDEEGLYEVILGDHPINREIRKLDAAAHAFVALHLPAAASLRAVSSILRLNIALERIGDYAVTIGRSGVHISAEADAWLAAELRELAVESVRMLDLAVRGFVEDDLALAERTLTLSRGIDQRHDRIFAHLTSGDSGMPVADLVRWLTIAGRLERVSDQAKGVCQETQFALTGGTGRKRLYRILFVDPSDGLASRVAQARAEARFSQVATFSTASWEPAREAHSRLSTCGFSVDTTAPRGLPDLAEERFDVVIVLDPSGAAPVRAVPFRTVRQLWSIDAEHTDLEDVVRDLDARLDRLMDILCEDATSR
jgi:phosphate transport system protein